MDNDISILDELRLATLQEPSCFSINIFLKLRIKYPLISECIQLIKNVIFSLDKKVRGISILLII
jgi:hypothetical protein